MSETTSAHYDGRYFDWQSSVGAFGGWANRDKFDRFIEASSSVLDFGCGGGYLLKELRCGRRIGVEVNPAAAEVARANGVEVYASAGDAPDGVADVIISNNALEHTLRPLDELKTLLPKLKPGGRIVFVVPCESVSYAYRASDINHHLYSWSPMCIGNLFTEAGYGLIESQPYMHKWPPGYRTIARLGGRPLFSLACRLYARIERSWFQVRVVARRPAA